MLFKRIAGIFGAVVIALTLCVPAFAAPKFLINGVSQPVGKLAPFMEKGVVYVPARFAAQGVDAQIRWSPKLQTAIIINTQANKTMIVTVGKKIAIVNNSFVNLPAAPKIVKGAIFIPLRPIAVAFGKQISWDAKKQIAYMNTPGVTPAVAPKSAVSITKVPPAVVQATSAAVLMTPAAVVATQSAVQIQPTSAAVALKETAKLADFSGLWEDHSGNKAYLYQSDGYAAGQFTFSGKTGVLKGEVTPDSISGVYWQGGEEGKFNFRIEPATGALRGTMGSNEISLSHSQAGYMITPDKKMTFNGKWMDIWGNVITIDQADPKDATRVVNGTYVDAEGTDMGSFRGTAQSGVYSGEYLQNETKDQGAGVFAFTLNASGMSYNGKYSLPGSKDMGLPWDAIRVSY